MLTYNAVARNSKRRQVRMVIAAMIMLAKKAEIVEHAKKRSTIFFIFLSSFFNIISITCLFNKHYSLCLILVLYNSANPYFVKHEKAPSNLEGALIPIL